MRQAQVVVGPQHDPLLALDDDDRVLGLGDRLEIRVQPRSLDFPGPGELPALVEERDMLQRPFGYSLALVGLL